MVMHRKGLKMSTPQYRSGVHAWDERDARSIASNTPAYRGTVFTPHPDFRPVPAPGGIGISATTRFASALLARIRSRRRPAGGSGQSAGSTGRPHR